jgi:hypothetical protein
VESTAPQVSTPIVLTTPLVGNAAATFRGTYRDSVRVDSAFTLQNFAGFFSLRYDAAAGTLPAALTSPFQIVPGASSATASVTIPQFIRAIAPTTGVAATRVATFQMGGTNAAGLNGFSVSAPIDIGVLPAFTPTTFSATNTFNLGFTNGAAAGTTNVSIGGSNPTTGTPSTGTFTATITNTNSPAASFASPFSRIDLFYVDAAAATAGPGSLASPAAAPVYRFLGSFSPEQLTVTTTTAVRTATFNFSIPATLAAQATTAGTPVQFIALGVNSNGDALVVGAQTITIFK